MKTIDLDDRILQVASFLNGMMAYIETSAEKEISDDRAILSWMGCGASDNLTKKQINDFINYIKETMK